MQRLTYILYILPVLLLVSCKSLQINHKKPDSNFHLYLLVGQSNMAGRGEIDSLSTPNNPRIVMLTKDNQWITAKDPLHFDKPKVVGVGPGLAFAKKLLAFEEDKSVRIGLIPCAVGGTSIDMWQPGKDAYDRQYFPYDDAIKRLHVAMQDGVVKGIIWHQGEADSREERAKVYIGKLQELIHRFRNEIGNPTVPFVAGELGYYRDNYMLINRELKKLPETVPFSAVATSERLTHKGDGTHLNSESARKLGERMAIRMRTLQLGATSPEEADNKNYSGSDGWQPLFKTTKDTIHWTTIREIPFPNEGWQIKDDELIILPGTKGGDIITKKQYTNFELELEFKMTRLVNSGIKYSVHQMENSENGKTEWIGFEYQIIDDFHQDEIKGFDNEKGSTAALYLLYAPDRNKKLNPSGEWNSMKIKVQGSKIEHWLNGNRVLNVDIDSQEFRNLVQETKFKNYPGFSEKREGHILIQDHGGQIHYRNIMIKEL